jgi:hypothetical protein
VVAAPEAGDVGVRRAVGVEASLEIVAATELAGEALADPDAIVGVGQQMVEAGYAVDVGFGNAGLPVNFSRHTLAQAAFVFQQLENLLSGGSFGKHREDSSSGGRRRAWGSNILEAAGNSACRR